MAYESLQPLFWPEFDWSRLETRYQTLENGLVFCVPMLFNSGAPFEYISSTTGTFVGTASTVGSYQAGGISALGSGNYVSFGNLAAMNRATLGSGAITIAVLHSPISVTQSILWTFADVNSSDCPGALSYSFSTSKQYAFWSEESGSSNVTSGASLYDIGSRNFVVGKRDKAIASSPTCSLFVNGVKFPTTTGVNSVAVASGQLCCINRFGGFNGYMGDGIFGPVYVWNRELSDSEILALSDDPYGIFRPVPRTFSFLFMKPSTGTNVPEFMSDYRYARNA